MVVSFAENVILSLIVDWLFRKLTIPGLVSMLLLTVVFGAYALAWVSRNLQEISGNSGLIAVTVSSYLPKSTEQTALGRWPLAAMRMARIDVALGEVILAAGGLSIFLSAPP